MIVWLASFPRSGNTFFRSGATGTHRTELSADLHDLFWAPPDNAKAMRLNGYR